jgi:hypothetical protein
LSDAISICVVAEMQQTIAIESDSLTDKMGKWGLS